LALLRIVEGEGEGALGNPERHRRGADALRVVGRHEVGEAVAEAARREKQRRLRELHLLEADLALGDAAEAHRRLALADDEAPGLAADGDEPADAFLTAGGIEDAGEDEVEARDAAAGDPVLAAVDHEAVAAAVGARRHL